jgi:hypothetical protein
VKVHIGLSRQVGFLISVLFLLALTATPVSAIKSGPTLSVSPNACTRDDRQTSRPVSIAAHRTLIQCAGWLRRCSRACRRRGSPGNRQSSSATSLPTTRRA